MKASIVGGSGYAGGELLRLLLTHPEVEVMQVTSQQHAGKFVTSIHPNLRGRTQLKFCRVEELEPCEVLFLALPHGRGLAKAGFYRSLAPRVIDLSADYRLNNPGDYPKYYGFDHPEPEFLPRYVYGIAELYRDELRQAKLVAGAGCFATAVILALAPLFRRGLVRGDVVVEGKLGSSAGGNTPTLASHHAERTNVVRAYKPTGHRHSAEVLQELTFASSRPRVYLSATSVELVRGIQVNAHVPVAADLGEKDVWRVYREDYQEEPFIRIIKERRGIYRYPEPKILAGTNYCDIGFEKDPDNDRLVVLSAIDNLMKGSAGAAVQAMNLMLGLDETLGLDFPGLHP